jgi:hypothetical protein
MGIEVRASRVLSLGIEIDIVGKVTVWWRVVAEWD